jgi:hypothetical protein
VIEPRVGQGPTNLYVRIALIQLRLDAAAFIFLSNRMIFRRLYASPIPVTKAQSLASEGFVAQCLKPNKRRGGGGVSTPPLVNGIC